MSTPNDAELLRKVERALEAMLKVLIEISPSCSSCAESLGGLLSLADMVIDNAVGELDGVIDDFPVGAYGS